MRYQENGSGMGTIIGLAIGGAGLYFLGNMLGWWGASTPPASGPATPPSQPGTPATNVGPPATPPATSAALTAALLATTPFSSAQEPQFSALNSAVDALLGSGQVKTIAGNSDLAYMLGWGGGTKGQSKTYGQYTYNFDGTNWVLGIPAAGSQNTPGLVWTCPSGGGACYYAQKGVSGYGTQTRAYQTNYVRKQRFA